MKTKIMILVLMFFCTISYAQNVPPKTGVPPTMVEFLDDIEALQPLMVSEKEFSSPKNKFNIQTRLDHLAEISGKLHHESRLDVPFFKVMTDILPLHLAELKDTFQAGNKEHARAMLNATLDGCSSCHSQVKDKNTHLWKFDPQTIKGNDFEKAEFLFAVRQYDEALSHYRKVVEKFKPTAVEPINQDVQVSLHKKQSILVRSKRNLSEAQKEIEQDLGKPELPEVVKVVLRANLDSIKEMKKTKAPNPFKTTSKQMEIFAAKTLAKSSRMGWLENRNAIPQMYVSSLLYDFAMSHPVADIGPGIYYWLAKCEKKTSTNYYFPVVEFYLKECVDRFPLTNEGKLCYNELESMTLIDDLARR